MAECHGLWNSWINPNSDFPDLPPIPSDGVLFVDQEDSLGNFPGAHLPTFERLSGQCIPPVNTPHRIMIVRTGQSHIYRYQGDITEDPATGIFVVHGRRITIMVPEGKPELLPDDEVWVGVKTT